MTRLLQGRDEANIVKLLAMLHDMPEDSPYRKYMPPLVGKPDEVSALAKYLATLSVQAESKTASTDVSQKNLTQR